MIKRICTDVIFHLLHFLDVRSISNFVRASPDHVKVLATRKKNAMNFFGNSDTTDPSLHKIQFNLFLNFVYVAENDYVNIFSIKNGKVNKLLRTLRFNYIVRGIVSHFNILYIVLQNKALYYYVVGADGTQDYIKLHNNVYTLQLSFTSNNNKSSQPSFWNKIHLNFRKNQFSEIQNLYECNINCVNRQYNFQCKDTKSTLTPYTQPIQTIVIIGKNTYTLCNQVLYYNNKKIYKNVYCLRRLTMNAQQVYVINNQCNKRCITLFKNGKIENMKDLSKKYIDIATQRFTFAFLEKNHLDTKINSLSLF